MYEKNVNDKDNKVYYQPFQLEPGQLKNLKKGRNVLAVFTTALHEGKFFLEVSRSATSICGCKG